MYTYIYMYIRIHTYLQISDIQKDVCVLLSYFLCPQSPRTVANKTKGITSEDPLRPVGWGPLAERRGAAYGGARCGREGSRANQEGPL